MNHSILTADRNTHFKVAGLALVAVIMIAAIGFTARLDRAPGPAGPGLTAAAMNTGPATKVPKDIRLTEHTGIAFR